MSHFDDDDEYDRHGRAQRVRTAAQQMLNDEDDQSNAAAADVVSAQVEFLTEAIRALEEQNEKKDHDLRLSAQLGQMLMEKNEDLANRVSELEQKYESQRAMYESSQEQVQQQKQLTEHKLRRQMNERQTLEDELDSLRSQLHELQDNMNKSPVRIDLDSPRAFAAEPRSPGGPGGPHPDVVAVESVNRELRLQIDNQQGKIKELESKLDESEASRRRLLLAADANTVVAEPVSPVISSDTVELQRLRQQLSELRSDFNALLREKEQLSATVDSLELQKHEMQSQHQASISFLERQTSIIQPQLIELPPIVELPLSEPQSTETKTQKPVSLLDDMEDDDLPAAGPAPQTTVTAAAEPTMRDYFMATFKALQQKFGSTITQSVNITDLWLSAEQSNLPFQYYYEWIELEIGKHIAHDAQSDSDGSNLVQSITAFQKLREQLLHKRAEIDVLRKQSTELQQKLGLPTSFLLSDAHADTNTEADTSGDNKMSFSKLLDTAKAKSRALSGAASPKAGAVSPKTTAGGDDGDAPWVRVMDSISDSISDSLSNMMTASLPLTEDEIRLQKGVGLARKSVPRTPKQGTSSATAGPDKAKASLLMRFTDFLFGPDEF